MFQIETAGMVVALDNRYDYVRQLCEDYLTDDRRTPDFTIGVTEHELDEKMAAFPGLFWNKEHAEPILLYEKLSCAIVEKDAFVLHSSVVAVDGRSYAFAAGCGVGKTTHTRYWQELLPGKVTVINGDKPIYRFMGQQLTAFGTPWCGKERMQTNTSAPLAALCLLSRGETNRIERVDGFECLGELTRHIYLPGNGQIDILHIMDLLERMLAAVPVYRLTCTNNVSSAAAAYEELGRL